MSSSGCCRQSLNGDLTAHDYITKRASGGWTWFEDYVFMTAEYFCFTPPGRTVQVGMGVFVAGEPRGEKVSIKEKGAFLSALQTAGRIARWLSPRVVALPLVLPPAVLGFYLLVALGPEGSIGRITRDSGIGLSPFTFPGLVIASVLYSLPFAVQAHRNAFEAIGESSLEVAPTLGAGPWDTFFRVAFPLRAPVFSRRPYDDLLTPSVNSALCL